MKTSHALLLVATLVGVASAAEARGPMYTPVCVYGPYLFPVDDGFVPRDKASRSSWLAVPLLAQRLRPPRQVPLD
jgi:hypothetical protein